MPPPEDLPIILLSFIVGYAAEPMVGGIYHGYSEASEMMIIQDLRVVSRTWRGLVPRIVTEISIPATQVSRGRFSRFVEVHIKRYIHLQSLNMDHTRPTNNDQATLTSHCKILKSVSMIHLHGVTWGLEVLVSGLTLTHLSVGPSDYLSVHTLSALGHSSGTTLRCLRLLACDQLDDEAFKSVGPKLRKLEVLSLAETWNDSCATAT